MSDDCVELVCVKEEPIEMVLSEDLISDEESNYSQDTLPDNLLYHQHTNGIMERLEEKIEIKEEPLSEEEELRQEEELLEEVATESPAKTQPTRLPVISNVHSLRSQVPNPPLRRAKRLLSPAQPAVKVKTEPVDDSTSGKRRFDRKSSLDKPTTSRVNQGSVKIKQENDVKEWMSDGKSAELSAIHELLATIQKPVDEDQVYGEHVACELRAIRDPVIKRRCKCAISEALLNAHKEDGLKLQ